MNNIISLENNFILETIENDNISNNTISVNDLDYTKILSYKQLLLKIDFSEISLKDYKKILKKILHIKKKLYKKNFSIGKNKNKKILLGYVLNYDESNHEQNEFINAINAIFHKSKPEMYNYIYDTTCDYLDSFFYGKNLCDFQNNKCGEKRKVNSPSCIGCCHHYKNKLLGPLIPNNLVDCEYLKEDYSCGAKCIGCKLFTCDYLEKKGVKFRIKDFLLLDTFFNPIQKYFIKTMVFTPKEKILKRLVKL